MAARRLPYELQAILFHSLPPLRPLPTLPPTSTFLHRNISIPTNADHFVSRPSSTSVAQSTSTTSTTEPSTPHTIASLFEPPTPEYTSTPPSTLDFPLIPIPRSTDDALLFLLSLKPIPPSAQTLLQDLKSTSQPIPPRYAFFKHALSLFNADPESNWLEWWELAPEIGKANMSKEKLSERKHASQVNTLAKPIIEYLLKQREPEPDWEKLLEFARVLGRQGYVRLVAERMLEEVAAFGPRGLDEKLWGVCLEGLEGLERECERRREVVRRRDTEFGEKRKVMKIMRRKVSKGLVKKEEEMRLALVDQEEHQTTAWIQETTKLISSVLVRKRSKMITLHANYGRLSYSVQLLEEATRMKLPGRRNEFRPTLSVYLVLLAIAAQRQQYKLFQDVYRILESQDVRLTRVTGSSLPDSTPYLARRVNFSSSSSSSTLYHDDHPTDREAYTTFRFSGYSSGIEEGDPEAASLPKNILRQQVQDRDFDNASRSLLKILTNYDLPPPIVTAEFLTLAQEMGKQDFINTVGMYFTQQAKEGKDDHRLISYWRTTLMIVDLQRKDYIAVITRFNNSFEPHSMPPFVRQLLRSYSVPSSKKTGVLEHPLRLRPNAYTFSLVTQAIIEHLTLDEQYDHIDTFYKSLVSAQFHLLPSLPSTTSTSPNDLPPLSDTDQTSPLDPFTFTPILLSYARRPIPSPDPSLPLPSTPSTPQNPHKVLSILLTMHNKLRLPILEHHYSILLASFARWSPSEDVLFLLDLFEGERPSTEPSERLRRQLMEWRGGGEVKRFGEVVWTGVVRGLLLKGEKEMAREVVERVQRQGREGEWEGEGDERWRGVVEEVFSEEVGGEE